ncbi:MAG: leucine-rich repeat domain-containing protein, partial [Planctomycetes bacterium]|nr:leucine-rich repeat domain-containing protein [Planctomycetota bacterium]
MSTPAEHAQKHIAECRAERAVALRLMDLKLGSVPDEVFELTWLTSLDLEGCGLTELPPAIGNLKQLTILDVRNNQLSTLPPEVGQLASLTTLALSSNQLSTLPPEVGQLASLTRLDLSSNQLSTLPPEVGQLASLTRLDLSSNQLSTLPPEVGQLASLTRLDLSSNQLSTLPPEVGQLELQGVSWEQNPWDEPLAKAWERGWGDVRVYLQGLADSRKCYEAKLVLVGEGNVGKTSLVAALRDESFVENRSTTHGIEVRSFQVDHPDEVEQDLQITLNSWDFGGQRVYRITHQFFFSPRSLFLVVWWPREGVEQNDVEGWIERIQLRVGDQARVLVVATHTDEHSRVPRINKEGLKRRFGEMIVGFHAVDSREMHNIDQLRTVIAQAASQLPQMGEPLPAAWQRIREDINKREDVQIPFEKFRELCAQENLKDDAVRALSNLMNDLGDVVYFSESEGLAEHMVLNPEWLTRAIGYVLEDKPTNDAAGVLAWSRLHEVWSSNRPDREDYEAWAHPFFLRLMEQFDISYRLGNETSLVSQLVPTDEPAEVQTWRDAGDGTELTLVCRLSSEATGLIPWLIVRTHWYSQRIHWQGGMLLNHPPHGEALIELTGRNLRITVRARFPTYLMDILKDTVNFLMEDRWPGLKHRWAVQCVTDDCPSLLNVEALLSRRKEGRQNTNCSECGHDLDIDVLLR